MKLKLYYAVISLISISNLFFAQSVGIGTTQFVPSATLEIRGIDNTAATYALKILNSSSFPLMYIQNDGNVGIGTSSPIGKFHLNNDKIGTDSSFTISYDGFVGIGTSNPAERFHIFDNIYNPISIVLEGLIAGGGTARNYISASGGFSSTYNGIALIANGDISGIQSNTALPSWAIDLGGTNDAATLAHFQDTYTLKRRAAGGGTFSNFMTVISSGNIGIGTTAPNTLLDINGAISLRPPATISLTGDNQTVTVGNNSYLRLSSNDATGSNRTIVLSQGLQQGQIIMIELTSNQAELLDNGALSGGGNQRLSANLTLTSNDIIKLIWNGTDWIEISRSVN